MQVMREEKYCIKIRSLFNIRKEKKISFKRGWKNIHFNFSNNHISLVIINLSVFFTTPVNTVLLNLGIGARKIRHWVSRNGCIVLDALSPVGCTASIPLEY